MTTYLVAIHFRLPRVVLLLLAFLIIGSTVSFGHGPDGKGSAMYEAYERGEIDQEIKGKTNPLDVNDSNINKGMMLYQQNCVMCHGANAIGDGHMAQMLETKPANLRMMVQNFPDVDDYYFWVIDKGGNSFDVPMPSYGGALSDKGIWQIVTWMQNGFRGAGSEIQDEMHHEEHKSSDHMMNGTSDHMMNGENHGHQMMGQ